MAKSRVYTFSPAMAALAALLFFAATSTAHASPWPRESDRFFVSSRGEYFLAEAPGASAPSGRPTTFERYDSSLYAEYGVAASTTLGGKVAYGQSSFYDGFGAVSAAGFSEIEGFVQRRVLDTDASSLSLKLTAGIPSRLGAGARPGLESDGVDLELRALYGRNLFLRPFKTFASIEAGYRRRFGDAADQVRADLLIGAEPARQLLLLFEILSVTSMRNAAEGGADFNVVKLQPSLVWRYSRRFSIRAGTTREFAGRNLITGNAYFLDLWVEF